MIFCRENCGCQNKLILKLLKETTCNGFPDISLCKGIGRLNTATIIPAYAQSSAQINNDLVMSTVQVDIIVKILWYGQKTIIRDRTEKYLLKFDVIVLQVKR